VLCNDLKEACAMADHINQRQIWAIVNWLYNDAPSPCWGSEMNFNNWIKRRNP
jgi:hypothetical protein